jgi:DNA-binding GntR family transcriptional regulator
MSPVLVGRDLRKSFGFTQALLGASITLNAGEIVAVMGPSGSGKSTLLHCLAGILTPVVADVEHCKGWHVNVLSGHPAVLLTVAGSVQCPPTATRRRSGGTALGGTVTGIEIAVDRTSPVPLYFQVAEQVAAAIQRGELAPGDRLDSEIQLADRLGLSRPTVRQAIQHLVDKGLIVRRRGVGTQVVRAVHRSVELTSLYDDLVRAGQRPTTSVLELSIVAAPVEVAAALAVPAGAEVQHLRRLRFADGEPLALMENWLPRDLVGLTMEGLQARGLYAIMRSAGLNIRGAQQRIGARAATAAEAHTLGERRGAPLLTMTRTAYDDRGRQVEHGAHIYRASRYVLEVTVADR